jgi:hypothetical protein
MEAARLGSVETWLNKVETKAHGSINIQVHDEAGLVDLSCFDCDTTVLHAEAASLQAANEFEQQ